MSARRLPSRVRWQASHQRTGDHPRIDGTSATRNSRPYFKRCHGLHRRGMTDRMPLARKSAPPASPPPGLAARRIAADIVGGVLRRKRPLDELLETTGLGAVPERDRALTRTIVATVLRRLGTLRHLLMEQLERGLPHEAPHVGAILLIGAVQVLFLEVPDHAGGDLSGRLAKADRHGSRYSGLINAVLRRLARDGKARLAALDAVPLDTPEWLMRRWIAHYGEATARANATAPTQEPALDLTAKNDPEGWAATPHGRA